MPTNSVYLFIMQTKIEMQILKLKIYIRPNLFLMFLPFPSTAVNFDDHMQDTVSHIDRDFEKKKKVL